MHDLDLDLSMSQGKYVTRKPIHNLPYNGNSNLYHICHRLQLITYELPKYCSFESLTFKYNVNVMWYNVADDICR